MMLEGLVGKTQKGEVLRVREVWQDNLEAEIGIIEGIVDEYPFLAMDTEFPGVPLEFPCALATCAERHCALPTGCSCAPW